MSDEERVERILWIYETITNPLEIRRSHLKSVPFREVYINRIYVSEQDEEGESFVVGANRRLGKLDFRTAMVPKASYLDRLMEGKLLWPL